MDKQAISQEKQRQAARKLCRRIALFFDNEEGRWVLERWKHGLVRPGGIFTYNQQTDGLNRLIDGIRQDGQQAALEWIEDKILKGRDYMLEDDETKPQQPQMKK